MAEPEAKKVKFNDTLSTQEPQTIHELLDIPDINQDNSSNKFVPQTCPYLDQVDRPVLDFDFEKVCSISLSRNNVYMCLSCGKYFQGRGEKTHAFTHSLIANHHVFLCLKSRKFYCLPDNYEVVDNSLDDILYCISPLYNTEDLKSFTEKIPETLIYDTNPYTSRALDGKKYLPGIIGLNDIKNNDYANVFFHAMAQVVPIRNFFLLQKETSNKIRLKGLKKLSSEQQAKMFPMLENFGELLRKMYNKKSYRAHNSPHEMLQAVSYASDKKFNLAKKSDCLEFTKWFINQAHIGLGGTKSSASSVMYKALRGYLHTWIRYLPMEQLKNEKIRIKVDPPSEDIHPFLMLSLDVPELKLFADKKTGNHIIPTIDIELLLQKYNGVQETQVKRYGKDIKCYRHLIHKPPEYLIITIDRFIKSIWDTQKNPTVVTFPLKDLDLTFCMEDKTKKCKYDIITNIVHDDARRDELDDSRWREKSRKGNARKTLDTAGKPDEGYYRVQVLHQQSDCWFEIQDVSVKQVLREEVQQSESYIQIWKRTFWGDK